jgi:hypothetical protein
MPNPGGVRLTVGIVGLIAGGYALVTGEELPAEVRDQLTGGLDNATLAYAMLAMAAGTIYSRFFPSKPA